MDEFGWEMVIITDQGKETPHFAAYTKERCEEEETSLLAQCGGTLPKGVSTIIRETQK